MSDRQQLLAEVYHCEKCEKASELGRSGFSRPKAGAPLFKFPPTIGATGRAQLLFVGINPRISPDNQDLHDRIIADRREFRRLARNWDGGKRYIEPECAERHYHPHMRLVQRMFGEQARFEDYAAVTELFFCATETAGKLPCASSPCANTYFKRVFEQVSPRVVVCVGKKVLRYFQNRFDGGESERFVMRLGERTAVVMWIAHPGNPDKDTKQREQLLRGVVEEARGIICPGTTTR